MNEQIQNRQENGQYSPVDILSAAMDIGQYLLKYGSEVHRVEDTVTRICRAYGAERVEVWAIDSIINATAYMPNGDYSTQVRRISSSSNHLARLEALNQLSREICASTPPPSDVINRVREIRKLRPVHPLLRCVGGALGAGAFAIFFGGSLLDGACSAVIGFLMSALTHLKPINANATMRSFILSFFNGTLSSVFCAVGFGHNLDKVAIGTIMLVIPGMAFCNALRDVMYGDTASGTMGFSKAIVCALMVVLGYFAAFLLCNNIFALLA
ncbi:MAG: threonine/serine exporter family protein [Clostridia bacterium]|nr:threonine/serine exporter family protein [Clostridia bacterium]